MQEVFQDLIYELLGQAFPSGAAVLLGDLIEPVSYIAWSEPFPQAGGKS